MLPVQPGLRVGAGAAGSAGRAGVLRDWDPVPVHGDAVSHPEQPRREGARAKNKQIILVLVVMK